MKYCRRCCYPANHPLNIVFDDEGICSGCRIHEEKDLIEWSEQGNKLSGILNDYKCKTPEKWDCIIPVTGASDSYFIVDTIKNKFKMNPLLVSYNKHYNTELGIRNLAYLRTIFDCDIITKTVDPKIVKKITRATLNERGSIYWHILAGSTAFPVQIAVKFKIPLIIWGVHQGCDQVGMFSHLDEVEMTGKYRRDHDLIGLDEEYLLDGNYGIEDGDIEAFTYPHAKEIESVGVRGIYLSNYIRWDTKAQHEKMIDKYGYESGIAQRTIDNYNYVDCHHYTGLHDYIKFLKFGYGKITDNVNREIRFGRLSRNEGIDLIKSYQFIIPKEIHLFCEWLGITQSELFENIDQHRDSDIWTYNENNGWELLDSLDNHRNETIPFRGAEKNGCTFLKTSNRSDLASDKEYILIAKGYIN
ncbi:LPS biosynthesis protein [Candidatus Woesearchaeota archaeon]|nr:LPS biosynthesis protein [Candidatus Woesearchaeota archaeon]